MMNDNYKGRYTQDDLFKARVIRDNAMQRAVDHADNVIPKWSDKAHEYLKLYVATHKKPFICDDLRAWSEAEGLEVPPSGMAWGSVMVQACKRGVTNKVGWTQGVFADRPNTHTKPVTLWIAA